MRGGYIFKQKGREGLRLTVIVAVVKATAVKPA